MMLMQMLVVCAVAGPGAAAADAGNLAVMLMQTGSVTDAIGSIIAFIKPIGWGLAFLGLVAWGVTKMAAPMFPELAQQFQGTISKIAMGALGLGIAPTIIDVLRNAFGG